MINIFLYKFNIHLWADRDFAFQTYDISCYCHSWECLGHFCQSTLVCKPRSYSNCQTTFWLPQCLFCEVNTNFSSKPRYSQWFEYVCMSPWVTHEMYQLLAHMQYVQRLVVVSGLWEMSGEARGLVGGGCWCPLCCFWNLALCKECMLRTEVRLWLS